MVAFGAAAKGSVLLNYLGIKKEQIAYVVDDTPAKVGKMMPGCHIPIVPMEALVADKPAWVVILPWNAEREIKEKLRFITKWGGKFIVP